MSSLPADKKAAGAVPRYVAAFLLLTYGFAKLTGAQFAVLDSELDKPLRDVSGFWLTWYYFGYSQVYGTLIALVQIGGALGLLIRRTSLVAAILLLPVIANIILIDILYGIDLGALVVAILIAACLVVTIEPHSRRLSLLLLSSPSSRGRKGAVFKAMLTAATIALPLALTYYIANYNNRHPTPIDGTWVVNTAKVGRGQALTHVYFERNRARMCVFRYGAATSTHHFEYDPRHSRIVIWDKWLTKGPLLLVGTYQRSDSEIELVGRLPGSEEPVTLRLTKVRPPS